jgi:hypothetical protein
MKVRELRFDVRRIRGAIRGAETIRENLLPLFKLRFMRYTAY